MTKDFWIAHFGHATEYNQLDEDRRYNGFARRIRRSLVVAGAATLQGDWQRRGAKEVQEQAPRLQVPRGGRNARRRAPRLSRTTRPWETRDGAATASLVPPSLHVLPNAPCAGDGRSCSQRALPIGRTTIAQASYDGSRADDGEDAITYDGSGIDANNAAQQRAQRQNRLHTGLGASRTH